MKWRYGFLTEARNLESKYMVLLHDRVTHWPTLAMKPWEHEGNYHADHNSSPALARKPKWESGMLML